MQALAITSELTRYNRQSHIAAWTYGLLSLVLWLLAIVIIVVLIEIPCSIWGVHLPRADLVIAVLLVLVLLAFEGFRHLGKLFDLDDYRKSLFSLNPAGSNERQWQANVMATAVMTPSTIIAGDLRVAYLCSQTLFAAPRCTAKAIAATRRRIALDAKELQQSQQFLDLLGAGGGPWQEVSDHITACGCMSELEQMGMIETRIVDGRMQVRMVPEVRRRHY